MRAPSRPSARRSAPAPASAAGLVPALLALALVLPAAAHAVAREGATPQTQAPAPADQKRNIAGPGDYPIREKIVRLIGRDPELSKEKFNVILVNGGAVFSGEIGNCALKKKVLTLAATTRGVINVTDEMSVPRGDVPDAELAKAVTGLLEGAAESLGLADLGVQVEDGVLALKGTVKDFAARARAEEIAGSVFGVTRISNHLVPAGAPSGSDDPTLLKAVLDYLADPRAFGMPCDIRVKVENGVVTLKGRTSLYLTRQLAAVVASLVRGVERVENRIKVDPSTTPRLVRVQAEK